MFRPAIVLTIPLIVLLPTGASAQSPTTSAKSESANAPVRAKGRGTVHRRAGYRAATAPAQRSCGAFMYFKNGKCNDARDKK
jgi:hypothetical protein